MFTMKAQMSTKSFSLRDKLTLVILGSALLPLLLMDIYVLTQFGGMSRVVFETITGMGEGAIERSLDLTERRASYYMVELAERAASYADLNFQTTQRQCALLAATMTDIYSNPGMYPAREIAEPQIGNCELAVQILYSRHVVDKSSLAEEVANASSISNMLLAVHRSVPEINTITVAFESGFIIEADTNSSDKFTWGNNPVPVTFDAAERPWYVAAKNRGAGEPVFTDVFEDYYGGGKYIVVSTPFYQGSKFVGVVAVGYHIDTIVALVQERKTIGDNFCFIVDSNGQAIISQKRSHELAVPRGSNLPDLRESSNKELADLVRNMQTQSKGLQRLELTGIECYVAYAPLAATGWSFAIAMPVDTVLLPVTLFREHLNALTMESQEIVREGAIRAVAFFVILHLVAIGLIIYAGRRLSLRITRPIGELSELAGEISRGDLERRVDIHTGDEIGCLAASFDSMRKSLKIYIDNLRRTTAEKERMQTELNVARDIQSAMLSHIFPPFPNIPSIDLFAAMTPAREVGGDFYDFFLIDKDRLCIVIADVSDKGVPAALFMAITRTLIAGQAASGHDPATVFTTVNKILCRNNNNFMFVTAFMGILDINSGRFVCANAGHEAPFLRRSGGDFEPLALDPGFVLAGMEKTTYSQSEMMLERGEALLLYTDGVTEARNEAGDFYGQSRLLEVLNGCGSGDSAQSLLISVENDVRQFAGDAEQTDDITILVLRRT